jgi:polyvinyl alcohol dehydrogenase (cytochrome)
MNAAATAITPATAPKLTKAWTWIPPGPTMPGQPGNALFASPTVVNDTVYEGVNTGVFFALSLQTGTVLWQQFLGFVPKLNCGSLGIISTATVAPDPVTGAETVYVAGGDGYMYALDAATGAIKWKAVIGLPSTTQNDYYDWSSPAVVNGNVYIGVASECDSPLIKGGLKEFNQETGALENFYQTNPGGRKGPSIWSSPAVTVSGKSVFVSTGNGPAGDVDSVVRLNASTLARVEGWAIPLTQRINDSDFGGSPTLFTATVSGKFVAMVGACNKNGVYYALRQSNLSAGPVWQNQVGSPNLGSAQCDGAAVWDGSHLFVPTNQTTINGTTFAGSIKMLNPATGKAIWQLGLPGPVVGSPSLDGSGVLAVPTRSTHGTYLVNAATGTILANIPTGEEFGQPVYASNMILFPTQKSGLWAYH